MESTVGGRFMAANFPLKSHIASSNLFNISPTLALMLKIRF